MTFLLTFHGNLLYRDGDRLAQLPADQRNAATPIRLDLPWERLRSDFDRNLRGDAAEIRSLIPFGDLAGFTLHIEADRRSVLLSHGGRYLSALPDGGLAVDRERAAGWERFVPVQPAELDFLLGLRAHDWILAGAPDPVPGHLVRFSAHHGLSFGGQAFDLRYQLPIFSEHGGLQLTLLREGWRMVKARAFKPLICYCAVGADVIFDQLVLSLTSLLRWGRYTGDIHLSLDREPAEVLERVPGLDPRRVLFKQLNGTDRVGAIAARYAISEWPDLAGYQPIFIVDTDIVFDAELAPLLAEIALSDRIMAPAEAFSLRKNAESVGAKLFEADGFDPGPELGFNAGSVGVPNLHGHGHVLRLIRRMIGNRSDLFGRSHFSWVDQPIANYVAALGGGFETSAMRRYVRWGKPGIGVEDRCGLVHFWPPRGQAAKLNAMAEYIHALERNLVD